MQFTVKQGLANVRPAKTEVAEVSTTPTSGNFKINAPGALAIGVKTGDFLNVVIGDLNEGAGDELFISKGVAGMKEDGKVITATVGAKLASSNGKLGGALQASSANIYVAMKGNTTENVVYTIDVDSPVDLDGTVYYRLAHSRVEAKQAKRVKKVSVEA